MNQYSRLEQLFHHFILGSNTIQKISYEFEKAKYLADSQDKANNPVFVMGLARSGTTTLLRLLHSSGAFESITYRDMPFVLMSRRWHDFAKTFHVHMEAIERAHGDSILVDFDSPESFEAIFWRTFAKSNYVTDEVILQNDPGQEALLEFKNYVALTANKSGTPKRYISKNNNNLIRLEPLSQFYKEGQFVVLWRDPLQTAFSSYKQHQHFCAAQSKDPFVLTYMNLISHYEFGLNHKPFKFEDSKTNAYKPADPNYWLSYWIDVHEQLLNCNLGSNLRLYSYEALCESPQQELPRLFDQINLNYSDEYAKQLRLSQSDDLPVFDLSLVKRAYEIASLLQEHSH